DRPQRRQRRPVLHPERPDRARHRRVADLQERPRHRRQRARGVRHLVPHALAARARRGRPRAPDHRPPAARPLRGGVRPARVGRSLQDRPHAVSLQKDIAAQLDALRDAGTFKRFNTLLSPQGPVVEMDGRGEVIVLSSNNYLGLAADARVVEAGIDGLRRYGAGTASVRFICGTFAPHLELERALADLSGTDAALTYVSCWNANEALIPTLTDERTVIFSDELNHASIVDAMRLAKPGRKVVYPHSDMEALRADLAATAAGEPKLIVTDGVFSMEGDVARLPDIVELAEHYDALVIVDDSHGVGVLGATGRGTPEHHHLLGAVDVVTGTLGKALGGAAGGYVAASEEICELLAQRSRP